METTKNVTFFSEFNTYNKCPLLWREIFVNKNSLSKQVNYHDFIYKTEITDEEKEKYGEHIIRAEAIKDFLTNTDNSQIILDGVVYKKINNKNNITLNINENNDLCLPEPELFESSNEIIIIQTVVTSSTINEGNLNVLAHLQKLALAKSSDFNNSNIKFVIRHVQPASLKKKKPETDEEFEARKAELLKKSKTGTTKAQKQQGETNEEFYERYKKAIKIAYIKENDNYKLVCCFESAILNKLKQFFYTKENPETACFNNAYCKYCEYNTTDGCLCMK